MKNLPVIFTAIATAFCLIILGLYLYQTAPEKENPNLTELELETAGDISNIDGSEGEQTAISDTPVLNIETGISKDDQDASIDNNLSNSSNPETKIEIKSEPDYVTLDLVNVSPDGIVVLSGQSNPESRIEIYHDENLIAKAKANGNGEWVAVPDTPLSPGTYVLTVEAKTVDGNTVLSSRAVLIVIPENGDMSSPLVALVPVDEASEMQAELLQSPLTEDKNDSVISVANTPVVTVDPSIPDSMLADPTLPPKVTIRMVEALDDKRMAVSGFRQGRGNIDVLINGQSANVLISPEGYLADANIPDKNQFSVVVTMTDDSETDDNGTALASARIILSKSKLDETLSGNALVVVQKGDALWRIAYRAYGQGIRYVDIYSSNANEIDDPDLIYPDQIFIIPNE